MTDISDLNTLNEWLSYDEVTGLFKYKKSPNRRKPIGCPAGSMHKDGYIVLTIGGRRHYAHRAAFLITYKWLPPCFIDHKDGDPSNNAIGNLRPATRPQNGANSKTLSCNTTGVKGVYFDQRSRKFVARFKHDGKQIHVGSFATLEESKVAIQNARTKTQGEFARHQ